MERMGCGVNGASRSCSKVEVFMGSGSSKLVSVLDAVVRQHYLG